MSLAPPRDTFAHWHYCNTLNLARCGRGNPRRVVAVWFDWKSARIRRRA